MSRIRKLSMNRLVNEWKSITAMEKDVHAAVCGDEGDGKTHLTCQLVNMFSFTDMWKSVVYSSNHEEFYEKYDQMHVNSALGIDEGLDFLDRQLWAKLETKKLVRHVRGKVRKEKSGVFLYNAQLFRDIHNYWRNHRLRYWIEVLDRKWFNGVNVAVVMRKGRIPFITGKRDVWLLDDSEKEWMISLSRRGKMDRREYLNALRRHPFYIGEFSFNALTPKFKSEYTRNRLKAIEMYHVEQQEAEESKISLALNGAIQLLRQKYKCPISAIAGWCDMSERTIIRRSKK